jgi:hypothetical protein
MLGQDVHGPVELIKPVILGFRQPHPIKPALVTRELGTWLIQPLNSHRQQGSFVGCPQRFALRSAAAHIRIVSNQCIEALRDLKLAQNVPNDRKWQAGLVVSLDVDDTCQGSAQEW